MGETKSEKIMIRVAPSTKEKWEEAVEEAGYGSLAGAIRGVMHSEFVAEDAGGTTQEVERSVDALREDVMGRLDDLADRVETIELEVRDDPDLEMLMADIFDSLPRLSANDLRSLEHEGGKDAWEYFGSTPPEIAERHDRSRRRTVEALEQLRIDAPAVRVREYEEERHYYVEE